MAQSLPAVFPSQLSDQDLWRGRGVMPVTMQGEIPPGSKKRRKIIMLKATCAAVAAFATRGRLRAAV